MRGSDLLRLVTAELTAAGTSAPRSEARWLLQHLYGLSPAGLLLALDLPDIDEHRATLIARRRRGIPLQHLLGISSFRHLDLEVGPGVFLPRPETEHLIDLAAVDLRAADVVVDLCAGSGAIALAVANEFSPRQVFAVERSDSALSWLRRNVAARLAAGDRPVTVIAADISDPSVLTALDSTVAVVLANPPYVPERLRGQLPVEVGYDPEEAVFSGPDGLELMPAVIATAARLLREGGLFVTEHDESHAPQLGELLGSSGRWQQVRGRNDLTGRPRFVTARRSGLR